MDFQKERRKKNFFKTSWVCGHQQTKIITRITSTLKFLFFKKIEKKGGSPKQVLCFSYLLCKVILKNNQCLLIFFVALNHFSGISLGINTLTTLKIQNFPRAISESPPPKKTNDADSSCSLTLFQTSISS